MIAHMLYASSRLELAQKLQVYLAQRDQTAPASSLARATGQPAMMLVVQALAYVPPGRQSTEGPQAQAPLGLLVVTDLIPLKE